MVQLVDIICDRVGTGWCSWLILCVTEWARGGAVG